MVEKKFNVIVAGATGAVGSQMLTCLEEQNFPVNNFKLLASSRSAGKQIKFKKLRSMSASAASPVQCRAPDLRKK